MSMKLKRGDLLVVALILLSSGLLLWALYAPASKSASVLVAEVNGEVVFRCALPCGEGHLTHTVRSGLYTNTIEIDGSRAHIVEANCPDQVCVHSGWIETPGQSIVCVPARLILRIEGEAPSGGVDALNY